ncbi:ABC transporter ATP-binding protein [Cupriavidus gilardii]|uniref:ABC transporter ATP-binding protein n=1 Tax=Cupriavidus gilardii TaxID=82541 RepID=UPI0021B2A114|nr:ABC transporter ATP-binding protein [Cupriavidus gilardii]UXC35430.1 ABC transporter ATP-binding protein [Cupriavidus gilardii]
MSSDLVIGVANLSKIFRTYERPKDRLIEGMYGLAARMCPVPALKAKLRVRAERCSRKFWALNNVSFEIRRGQTVGIVGRNGSGKSTLLQIICGTLAPTAGSAQLNGRVAALLELGSGFNLEFTGRENVFLNGQLYGLTRKQIEERYDDIVAFADIGDFVDQPVKTYSSGMLVRLAFAVIAHVDADVLIIDEALAVGDAFFTQKCMRFLRRFMQNGTILFVSHDMSSVKSLCSHAIWLEHGQVLKAGSPKEVCDAYLEAFYEAQQGKSTTTRLKSDARFNSASVAARDQRLKFINQTQLRNDLQLFEFDPNASSFGTGDAQIVDVRFLDEDGRPLAWVVGGEEVILSVVASVHRPLSSPIVGFYVKDRLGQTLFGDNTYLSYVDSAIECGEGEELEARFQFQMPILPKGDYSVCVAIAEGTQEIHKQLHWIHDALVFKSVSSSASTGLIGIPMRHIELVAGLSGHSQLRRAESDTELMSEQR